MGIAQCHALPGRLAVQRLIRCELGNPRFAYLSTSDTTVRGEENPDEVIHLASVFYKHMVDKEGHLDHTRHAYSLRASRCLVSAS
ncbi:hypothetical protein V8E55_004029 [Tylopilus felleus]